MKKCTFPKKRKNKKQEHEICNTNIQPKFNRHNT